MHYTPILDTEQAKTKNMSRSVIYAVFGVYLIGYSAYAAYSRESLKTTLAAFVMGGVVLFASNFSKRFFIADEGIVQSVRSWSGRQDTLMPWEDLLLVSFVTEKDNLTAYFDNGEKVWKLDFPSWQRKELKQLVIKCLPDMEINEITKK